MSTPLAALEVELDIPPTEARRKFLISCAINRMKNYQCSPDSSHLVGFLRAKRARTPSSSPVPGTIAHLLDHTPEGLAYPPDTDLKRIRDSREWHQEWTSESREDKDFRPPTGKNLYALDHSTNPTERLKRYSRLTRIQGRNILHLRTGHTSLQEDIMRVYHITPESTRCRYCDDENTRETADHVLFQCLKFATQRTAHLSPLAPSDRVELLNSPEGIKAIATFIDSTTIRIVRNRKAPPPQMKTGTGDMPEEGEAEPLEPARGNTLDQREEIT
jgi:hypothetical protein